MTTHGPAILLLFLVTLSSGDVSAQESTDLFAFFGPSVTATQEDRQHLDTGGTVARVIPGTTHAITIFSATPLDASGDRLIAWIRRIAALKQSAYVQAIGRFSNPPQLADLATLTLDDGDVDELQRCRPGRCGLKLAAAELAELQRVSQGTGTERAGLVQDAFRRLVLRRVQTYVTSGHAALPDQDDHRAPVSLQAAFSALLQQFVFLRLHLPDVTEYMDHWPHRPVADVESFLYWSKEHFGAKPVISATQLSILRGDGRLVPEAVIVGKQVFATHYSDGSLSVTAVVRDGPRRYLAYINESDLDVLDGFWGGLARRILERRMRSEAPKVLETLRHRLESGEPPP
ncbi:MAG: hypothetical protein LAO77_02790 [Acidobacteriia bacterium]|nr:hypothetical protein [Terriglobia bacterium]